MCYTDCRFIRYVVAFDLCFLSFVSVPFLPIFSIKMTQVDSFDSTDSHFFIVFKIFYSNKESWHDHPFGTYLDLVFIVAPAVDALNNLLVAKLKVSSLPKEAVHSFVAFSSLLAST